MADGVRNVKGSRVAGIQARGLSPEPRVPGCQGDERTKSLATVCQPVPGDFLGFGQRGTRGLCLPNAQRRQQAIEFLLVEQAFPLAHQRDVSRSPLIGQGFVNFQDIPHPGFIQRGVLAVPGMEWDGVGWNAGQQHFVDGLFQHVQTGNPHDTIDVALDDNLEHDRRPFRHQNLVPQLFRLDFVIGNVTGATGFAIQTEFVVIGWATFRMFQTVGQQQHPPLERNGHHLSLPEEIPQQHHRKAEITLLQPQAGQQFPPHGFQFGF